MSPAGAGIVVLTALSTLAAAAEERPLVPVEIQAKEMVVRNKDRSAVFTGAVQVHRDGYDMTCRRLTVTYDERHRVRRLVADGNVRVVQGERVVESERAVFDNETELLVLTGDPVLTEGENVVRGEKVTFDLPTDVVRVHEVKATMKMQDLRARAGGKRP